MVVVWRFYGFCLTQYDFDGLRDPHNYSTYPVDQRGPRGMGGGGEKGEEGGGGGGGRGLGPEKVWGP